MIHVKRDKGSTLPNGSTAAYAVEAHRTGETVPVMYGSKEGTAIVVKNTLILGGQLNLVILDVDWSSFDHSHDESS